MPVLQEGFGNWATRAPKLRFVGRLPPPPPPPLPLVFDEPKDVLCKRLYLDASLDEGKAALGLINVEINNPIVLTTVQSRSVIMEIRKGDRVWFTVPSPFTYGIFSSLCQILSLSTERKSLNNNVVRFLSQFFCFYCAVFKERKFFQNSSKIPSKFLEYYFLLISRKFNTKLNNC